MVTGSPGSPVAVSTWGPPAARPVKPVGMGDVLLGLLYAQVLGSVPVLLSLLATAARDPGTLTGVASGDVSLLDAIPGLVLVASLVASWAGFLLAVGWAGSRKGDRDARALIRWRFRLAVDIPVGIAVAVAVLAMGAAVGAALTAVGIDTEGLTNTGVVTSQEGIALLAMVLGVAVAGPIVEEVFFRGMFLTVATRNYGKAAAVILTSVVFGAMHVQSTPLASAVVIGQTTVIGVVLALLVLRTGRLGTSICAHVCINTSAIAIALAGLPG